MYALHHPRAGATTLIFLQRQAEGIYVRWREDTTKPGRTATSLARRIGIRLSTDYVEKLGTVNALAVIRKARRAQALQAPPCFEFFADSMAGEPATLRESGEWQPAAVSRGARGWGHPDLRRVNEQLVVSALSAQASAAQATKAHRQQILFMGLVAHELRNPLAPIRLAAGMLTGGGQSARLSLDRLSAIIETEVKHMARLIDDLLEGSRASTGKLRLELDQADLREVVAQAAESCRPLMAARRQRLTLALSAAPVNLHGDPVRLRQIVNNLLDNASKYTGEGGSISVAMAVHG